MTRRRPARPALLLPAPAAFALVALLVAALAPRPARAQAEEAEALIRQGMDLRKQGQDARALPLLEKAYKMSRTPRTAAQLGLVQMALGYWVEAERHLDEALADADNPWVAKNRDALGGARTRAGGMIGELTVTGEPAGAEVLINGRVVGRLPLGAGLRLGKGPVEVELRADGYLSASRSLILAGGAQEHVALTLARAVPAAQAGAEPARAPSAPPPARAPEPVAVVERPAPPPPAAPTRSAAPRVLAWMTAGVALAGVVFGVVETVSMQSRYDAFQHHTSPNPQDPSNSIEDCTTVKLTATCASLREDYDRAKLLTIVGYGVGGVFAISSAVLFIVSTPAQGGEARTALRSSALPSSALPSFRGCAPGLTAPGVVCALRF